MAVCTHLDCSYVVQWWFQCPQQLVSCLTQQLLAVGLVPVVAGKAALGYRLSSSCGGVAKRSGATDRHV
jgi:hypothetical protein